MTFPLISPDWDFALWAVLIGVAGFGFWADSTRIGRQVSGIGIMLVIAMLLGNFGVIPHAAPAYETVWSFLVPAAVPLLLLKANLRRIIPETGPMLGAYFLGVAGTLIGAVVGLWILPMGSVGPDLAGILSATYIGGSMNFAAVAEALEFTEATLLTAALAADNVVGTLHILIVVLIPSVAILRRWIPSPIVETSEAPMHDEITANNEAIPYNPAHICLALTISLAIGAIGYGIASVLNIPNYGILFITAITLLVANVFHNQLENLHGAFETGMLMMYIFFATIGAGADVGVMIEAGVPGRDRHRLAGLHWRTGCTCCNLGLKRMENTGNTRAHGGDSGLCNCQFCRCRASQFVGTVIVGFHADNSAMPGAPKKRPPKRRPFRFRER